MIDINQQNFVLKYLFEIIQLSSYFMNKYNNSSNLTVEIEC